LVSDLVNRELVNVEDRAVSVLPAHLVRQEIETAQGAGEREIKAVVEAEELRLLGNLQEVVTQVERDWAA